MFIEYPVSKNDHTQSKTFSIPPFAGAAKN